jgi:hypothetical protein
MSKVLAVMIAGLFAAGAYAQATKPGELDPTAQGKSAAKAEAKVAARPAGMVKAPGGDEPKTKRAMHVVATRTAA